MKIQNFWLIATTAGLSVSAATIRTTVHVNVTVDDEGSWRIPIRPFTRSATDVIDAIAILDIQADHGFQFWRPGQRDSRSAAIADGYFCGSDENQLVNTVPFAIPVESDPGFWASSRASIGGSFNSSLARMFPNFIISPTDRQSSSLVLNPETPEEYALDGQWFYVNSSHPQLPRITASVVVGNDLIATSPEVFSLVSVTDVTWIPLDAFLRIVHHLERAGFNIVIPTQGRHNLVYDSNTIFLVVHNGARMLFLPRSFAADPAQVLPPIHFQLSGNRQFRITIYPEDYMQIWDGGRTIRILCASEGDQYSIGTNVLRRLSLHIDSENSRIGFADPVNEI